MKEKGQYDAGKIEECFGNGVYKDGVRWVDLPDEIRRMQMSYPIHAILMGFVIDQFTKVVSKAPGVATVLDVGSGTGLFLDYVLEKNSMHRLEKYTGYDVVEEFTLELHDKMLQFGVNGEVVQGDFFADTKVEPADIVIASQCLNTIFSDEEYGFLEDAIEKLWTSCRKIVVFDLKDTAAPRHSETRTYYDPVIVYSICRKYTQNVTIVQLTKANFAVVMSREPLY